MTNKLTALIFISVFLLLFLSGCTISKNQNMGCCKSEDAKNGVCTLVTEEQKPIIEVNPEAYSDIKQLGCPPDADGQTLFCKVELTINEITKPYSIPVCTPPPADVACYDESCTAMFCGPLQYQAKIPVSDAELMDSGKKGEKLNVDLQASGLPAGTLAESKCIFTPIDDTFKNLLKNSKDSFVNTFRIGYFDSIVPNAVEGGDLYRDYSLLRYKFPLTDQFCAVLPDAKVDRFTNYLVPPGRVCGFGLQHLITKEQLVILEGRLKNEMDDYWEASSCLNVNDLPAYLQTDQYCEGSNSEYCNDGNYITKPNGEIDVEVYKNLLGLIYLPFIQNEMKAPFECYDSADCKSGYCSKDDYSRSGCMTNEGNLVGCLCERRQSKFYGYMEQVTLCRSTGETVTAIAEDECNAANYDYDFVKNTVDFGGHELKTRVCTLTYNSNSKNYSVDACPLLSQRQAINSFYFGGSLSQYAEDSVFRTELFPATQTVIKNNVGFSVMDPDEFKMSGLVTTCGLQEGRDYTVYNFAGWLLTHPTLVDPEKGRYGLAFYVDQVTDKVMMDSALRVISNRVPAEYSANTGLGDGSDWPTWWFDADTGSGSISAAFSKAISRNFDQKKVAIPMYYIKIKSLGNCRSLPGMGLQPEVTEYGWCAPCSYLTAVHNAGLPTGPGIGLVDMNIMGGNLPEDNPSYIFEDKTERYLKEGTMTFLDLSGMTIPQVQGALADFDNYGATVLIVGEAKAGAIPNAESDINKKIIEVNKPVAENGCPNCMKAFKITSEVATGARNKLAEEVEVANQIFQQNPSYKDGIYLIGLTVSMHDLVMDSAGIDCTDPNSRTDFYDRVIETMTSASADVLRKTGKPTFIYLEDTHVAPGAPCLQYFNGQNEFQQFMNRIMLSQYKFAQSGTLTLFLDSYKYGITEITGPSDAYFSCSLQKSTRLSVNKVPNFMYKRMNEIPRNTERANCIPCTPADIMLGKCNQPSARTCVGGNDCVADPNAGELQRCMDDIVVGVCKICSDPGVKDISYDCMITSLDGTSETKPYKLGELSDKTRDILAAIPPNERCCLESAIVSVPEGEEGQAAESPVPYTYGKIDIGVTLKSPIIYSKDDPSKACPATNDFGKVILDNEKNTPMCSADLNEGSFKTIFDTYTVSCKRS